MTSDCSLPFSGGHRLGLRHRHHGGSPSPLVPQVLHCIAATEDSAGLCLFDRRPGGCYISLISPSRILLILFDSQRDAYTWALDHRIHHKFSETDADPHNAKRGFFFAHVGWLFLTPHPKVVAKRKVIDMSDLEADAVCMFQRKYYIPLFALCSIILPVAVPWYFWNEDLWMSFWINFNMRFTWTLNVAFFVNSVAHMYGNKPYDK